MLHFFVQWSLSLLLECRHVEDVSSFSSKSLYRSLYFTLLTNVPLISFNKVGNVLIVSSVFWSPSKFVEFKQRGVAPRVLESGWYGRHVCVKRRALMRCLEPKLHRCMISECEYSSCSCMLSKSESLSSSLLQSSSLQRKENRTKNV